VGCSLANINACVGMSGSAKTLTIANFAWKDWYSRKRIYSNFYLEFDGLNMPFKEREKKGLLNFTPLYEPADLLKISGQSNIAIYLDELDAFGADAKTMMGGADSYAFKGESAVIVEKFFKKRLRKSHGKLWYTVQQLAMAPKRVREETEYLYSPKVLKWRKTNDPDHPMAPLFVVLREQKKDLASETIDIYHDTGRLKKLGHPLFPQLSFITPDMLRIYNTDSDIFSKDAKPTNPDNFRNPKSDDDLYKKCKRYFEPLCIVEKLKDSGRYSQWKGDVMITPKNSAPIILDATGAAFRNDLQPVTRLETRAKWGEMSQMCDIDDRTGSSHYLAYYNERKTPKGSIVKDWFVAHLDDVRSQVKHQKPKRLYVSKLKFSPLKDFAKSITSCS